MTDQSPLEALREVLSHAITRLSTGYHDVDFVMNDEMGVKEGEDGHAKLTGERTITLTIKARFNP